MGVTFTEEQQAVIDARKSNILVSAAAGSGKTAVLVERIIQMISSDVDIDHLLVVTFTKAAASQMKEKITLAIQKKIEEGLITKSEAARSNERSVVLQGVGISMQLKPELTFGKIKKGQNILLCTDGFWRKIEARDFLFLFQKNGNSCKTKLKKVTKDLIQRGETDNLSAVIVTD